MLPSLLNKYRASRPLIITDKGLVKLGVIERLGIGYPNVYDNVETNPTEAMVLEALNIYREYKCDSIIAVGGGSPIDLAKCVAILINHPLPLEQYALCCAAAFRKITSAIPPLLLSQQHPAAEVK